MGTFNHPDYISIATPVNSFDFNLFKSVVNQGIDSHLEGFTQGQYFFDCGKFHFHFHKSEKHILTRRLTELVDETLDDEQADRIRQWIEDIGNYDQIVAAE